MLKYERKSQPLMPIPLFLIRLAKHFLVSFALFVFSLGIGVFGYHKFVGLTWIDSFLNASMILGGMGPVNQIQTDVGKIFAAIYALFAGLIFVAAASIIIAPIAHRILHRLHIQEIEDIE
jgi:hypothetical protein